MIKCKDYTEQGRQKRNGLLYEKIFDLFVIVLNCSVVPVSTILETEICCATWHWANCTVSTVYFYEKKNRINNVNTLQLLMIVAQ